MQKISICDVKESSCATSLWQHHDSQSKYINLWCVLSSLYCVVSSPLFPSVISGTWCPLVKSHARICSFGIATQCSYIEEWQRYIATPETQAYLIQLLPTRITKSPLYTYKIPSAVPTGSSALFIYDAFVALAISTCDAAQVEGDTFSTIGCHNAFLNQPFLGATGNVNSIMWMEVAWKIRPNSLFPIWWSILSSIVPVEWFPCWNHQGLHSDNQTTICLGQQYQLYLLGQYNDPPPPTNLPAVNTMRRTQTSINLAGCDVPCPSCIAFVSRPLLLDKRPRLPHPKVCLDHRVKYSPLPMSICRLALCITLSELQVQHCILAMGKPFDDASMHIVYRFWVTNLVTSTRTMN